jgi:hypothetical protein
MGAFGGGYAGVSHDIENKQYFTGGCDVTEVFWPHIAHS